MNNKDLEENRKEVARELLEIAEDFYLQKSSIVIDPSYENLREATNSVRRLVHEGNLEEADKIALQVIRGIDKKLRELEGIEKELGT